ncbi:MAG: O-antigen ligase family protein [Pseudolabrys sp.]
MITARDMAAPAGTAPPPSRAAYTPPAAATLRERILLVVLFITVLASSVAFIEPSPHDALMGVLAVAALIAGVRFHRTLAMLVLCLVIWNVSGLISLINVLDVEKTVQYAATSIYLAIAAILFACLFADNTLQRLDTMRAAYVITAVCVSLAGVAGYFHAFPGATIFAPTGRALGAFKDPNVFSPFLIWPALFLAERMLSRRIGLFDLAALGALLLGLLLSFSRGAWFHFAVSAMVMVALAFLLAPGRGTRVRILGLSGLSVFALAASVVMLLAIPSVQLMFNERAHLINSYDVGAGGRFRLQELAVGAVLSYPDGMGPFGFATAQGLQQHNVYLQAFLVYGWVGGVAYIMLLLSTCYVALRAAFVRTPWQPYLITALAAFIGEIAEGFIVDTDHWRHFFLLLGIIWGGAAATYRHKRQARLQPARLPR